jgi:uncharacterized protein YjdB
LQLTATVTPDNATNKSVTWSIQNGTGQASINASGQVTAIANGTVTAKATANDGSGVTGNLTITISGQVIPVTGITVTGAGGISTITTDNGTLQLIATLSPENATNKSVTWSIQNETGQASISASGKVTAIANGTVTAKATANDGSSVAGNLTITISGQVIPVTNITVTGAGGATTITSDNGTLQLNATVTPENATNKSITWSIQNGTGQASISASGLLTAIANGTVTAKATANDGSGVTGSLNIQIQNQVIQSNINDLDEHEINIRYTQYFIVIKFKESLIPKNIRIYNLSGIMVLNPGIITGEFYIDTASLLPGTYIIAITQNETMNTVKFSVP